jgi:hypothetical protein
MSYRVNVFYSPVRKQQAILMFKVSAGLGCAIDDLLNERPILRMSSLDHQVQGRLGGTIVLKDAISFVCPDKLSRIRVPPEAAGVTESLGFRQVGFAPPEFPSEKLVLGDVNGVAYEPLQCPIL